MYSDVEGESGRNSTALPGGGAAAVISSWFMLMAPVVLSTSKNPDTVAVAGPKLSPGVEVSVYCRRAVVMSGGVMTPVITDASLTSMVTVTLLVSPTKLVPVYV
jgi:hypothetical protein